LKLYTYMPAKKPPAATSHRPGSKPK
jgi:hypothetical protein